MTNSQRLDAIRNLLRTWFERARGGQLGPMEESILIRDGFYCGRRFRSEAFTAVWFAEEDQIKMYDTTGQWIDAVRTGMARVDAARTEAAAQTLTRRAA